MNLVSRQRQIYSHVTCEQLLFSYMILWHYLLSLLIFQLQWRNAHWHTTHQKGGYHCKFYSPQFMKKRTVLQKARKSTSLPASPYKVTARCCLIKSFKGLPTFTIRPKSPSKAICYIIIHNFLVNSRLMCIVCPQLIPTTLKLENIFCIQRANSFIASLSLFLLRIVSDGLLFRQEK